MPLAEALWQDLLPEPLLRSANPYSLLLAHSHLLHLSLQVCLSSQGSKINAKVTSPDLWPHHGAVWASCKEKTCILLLLSAVQGLLSGENQSFKRWRSDDSPTRYLISLCQAGTSMWQTSLWTYLDFAPAYFASRRPGYIGPAICPADWRETPDSVRSCDILDLLSVVYKNTDTPITIPSTTSLTTFTLRISQNL